MAQGDSFAASVADWCHAVEGAAEAIFKESVQELVAEADRLLTQLVYEAPASPNYRRTGFLRSSVRVSRTSIPLANRPQGVPDAEYLSEITVVIAGAELGETLYVGYTANYAGFVHFGTSRMAGRPWVQMVAQRWPAIVAAKEAELKGRLGL